MKMRALTPWPAVLFVACASKATPPPAAPVVDVPKAAPAVEPPQVAVAEAPAAPSAPVDPGGKPGTSTCKVAFVLSVKQMTANGLEVNLALRNDGDKSIDLMMPGDGSDAGMRNPAVTFELGPNKVATEEGGRCGNVNPLSEEDFATLKPKESRAVSWVWPPRPAKAGRYTLRATYKNDPTAQLLKGLPLGESKGALIARARKTAPCTATSNEITFDWTPPPPAKP